MILELVRLDKNEFGVFGVLLMDGKAFCVTLEPEDKNNQENISCIPTGTYLCKRVVTPRHGETFQILNVPNRTNVLFHAGNTEIDTLGCVLVARQFGVLGAKRAILNSGDTFKQFMHDTINETYFSLHITEHESNIPNNNK